MAIGNDEDRFQMQQELNKVYRWANNNAMLFNDTKFEYLVYWTHQNSTSLSGYLTNTGNQIEKSNEVRDLGVLMSGDANFTSHIKSIVSKARRQGGWILRTFSCRDRESMLTLYKATVLPILEYCSQLWSPTKAGDIRMLESVQRNFTSKICTVRNLSYWERLELLCMYSLERRRDRYTVMYVYKVMMGIAPNLEDERFKIKTRYNERRGLLCEVPPMRSGATARIRSAVDQSFAIRGPRLFNSLPRKIRSSNLTFDSFKRQLDNFLSQVPDLPSAPNYPQAAAGNGLLEQLEQLRREGNFIL